MNFFRIKESLNELKSVKNLSLLALLMAMWIVLVLMVIKVSSFISISFEFIAVCLAGAIFGPIVAAIFGFFGDLLAYLVNPVGDFYFLFAISVMIDGIIYGCFLYKNRFGVKRVVFCQIVRDILTNLILNTIFIHMQTKTKLLPLFFINRLPKNIIKIPVNCVLIVLIVKSVEKVIKKFN